MKRCNKESQRRRRGRKARKESYLEKNWLIEVAKTVERNAKMYNKQLKGCEQKLNKKGFFGIF